MKRFFYAYGCKGVVRSFYIEIFSLFYAVGVAFFAYMDSPLDASHMELLCIVHCEIRLVWKRCIWMCRFVGADGFLK